MARRQLRRILFPTWPDMQALADEWKAFIERCDSWHFGVGFDFRDGDGGKTVELKLPPGLQRAVVTTAIPVAPDANSVSNAGRATLRVRTGTALADGATGQVIYSDFDVEVPVGTKIWITPDGDGWALVSAVFCAPA